MSENFVFETVEVLMFKRMVKEFLDEEDHTDSWYHSVC